MLAPARPVKGGPGFFGFVLTRGDQYATPQ